ncbi:MAG: multidrug DMT transporter permease [Deltaproteobacteria bacterium]|nr:MAG: multidrug DMT transporter permease [Deltaproteobacteria bacterium]
MPVISKTEADRYDKMLDAAVNLAEMIEQSKIEIDEYALEELTIFLATNASTVRNILKKTNRTWP